MILQSEENKGVEFTGNGNSRLGCGTNEESKVKSPTLSKTESMGHPKTLSLRHPPTTQKTPAASGRGVLACCRDWLIAGLEVQGPRDTARSLIFSADLSPYKRITPSRPQVFTCLHMPLNSSS
jgi:hypothetical protein